ncbi:MAG TPA: exodeoxyribonuclease III [Anaerolineae bacterium]|nr:exodeoxyribonuclease III [Anaerolineae bacterium]
MSDDVLKVATYNANSIRSRLELVLDWLRREVPDILCLQETKVQDADFPASAFRDVGYHVVFRGQKAHAGVAIVSREEPQEIAFGFDDGGEPDEARLIRAVIRGIPVVNTYVPQGRSPDSPQFQYKLAWLARLQALFERHYSPQEPLLWMGDFNVAPEPIDVHNPKRLKNHVDFHPEARTALERVKEWGFVDVFRLHHPDEPGQYTFWDYRVRGALERGLGWRVDHIWATEPLARQSTGAWIDVAARRAERPSDHTFLVAEFALGRQRGNEERIFVTRCLMTRSK